MKNLILFALLFTACSASAQGVKISDMSEQTTFPTSPSTAYLPMIQGGLNKKITLSHLIGPLFTSASLSGDVLTFTKYDGTTVTVDMSSLVSSTHGIDDVLGINQALTANRLINIGSFSLGITDGTHTLYFPNPLYSTGSGQVWTTNTDGTSSFKNLVLAGVPNGTFYTNGVGGTTVISATPYGGAPPYTYSLDGGAYVPALSSHFTVYAGTHTIAIKDNTGTVSSLVSFDVEDLSFSGLNLASILTNGNDGGGLEVLNIADPTTAQSAATKAYVDAHAGGISLTSLSATSPLLYNNTTGVFSIQQANTSQSGYLSNTDWNTFNGKQPAFGSQSANTFFAAANGSSSTPSFRVIVAADIPTLNQNTTGTASNITATSNSTITTLPSLSLPYSQITGTPSIPSSFYLGTTNVPLNRSSASQSLTGISIDGNAGTVTNGLYSTGSYNNPSWLTGVPYSVLTGTIPTWNQNTTGSAATLTTSRTINGVAFNGSANINILASAVSVTAVKTANYTLSAGDFASFDNTSGNLVATLPTAPADKTVCGVKLVTQGSANTITINAGGTDVFNKSGGSTSLSLILLNQGLLVQYSSATGIWTVIGDDLPLSNIALKHPLINTQTASYTLQLSDDGGEVDMNISSANNLTVPLNATVAFTVGTRIDIDQAGSGQVTFVPASGVTIKSADGMLKTRVVNSGATLVYKGSDVWWLTGDLSL